MNTASSVRSASLCHNLQRFPIADVVCAPEPIMCFLLMLCWKNGDDLGSFSNLLWIEP